MSFNTMGEPTRISRQTQVKSQSQEYWPYVCLDALKTFQLQQKEVADAVIGETLSKNNWRHLSTKDGLAMKADFVW